MKFWFRTDRIFCWQWDTKQVLEFSGLDEHELGFPYMLIGNSQQEEGLYKVRIQEENGQTFVEVPDEVLWKDGYADVYLYDEDSGTTILTWRFAVKKKLKPQDFFYESKEAITLTDLARRVEELERKVMFM